MSTNRRRNGLVKESHSYERYLLDLARARAPGRPGSQTGVERLLRESRLFMEKEPVDDLDLKRLPPMAAQQSPVPAGGKVRRSRQENVLVFRQSGFGKNAHRMRTWPRN